MLSDKLEEWAKEYIAEGRQEGEILALQKLLAKRFGAIPFDITAQIANASLDQIEHWFDKAIDADTLTDVFQ